ncbi:MAG TPA: MarR family transcriptional regulator [Lachnospiraceae bacterium]|nr:MarR family transcriptional regulator [Lachnospiraceae bacterium]
MTLCEDGLTSGELKEKIGVGSGRISDILRSLESKKLIQRMTDPEDNRRVRVYVTEKGKDFAKEKHDLMKKRLVHLMDFLGEKDAKELIRLMKRIKEYQEQMDQE